MRTTLGIILLIGLTASSLLWGHQAARNDDGMNLSPVATTSVSEGSQNRMGYGYIGPSEAASDGVMRFSCADADVNRTVGEICNKTGTFNSDIVSNFIRSSATPAVIEGIRAKIYEEQFLKRYALQQFPDAGVETEAALNGTPPPATTEARLGYPNHCMNWNQQSRQGQARLMRLRRENSGIPEDTVIEGLPTADKSILYKAKAMTNHWSNANLTKAVVLYDYFKSAKEKACAPSSSFAEACSDLRKKLTDVETTYPIFGAQYADDVSEIRSNMYKLYGVESMRQDNETQAETTGRAQYQRDINRTSSNFWRTGGYPNVVDQIESIVRRQSELTAPQNAMAARFASGIRDSAQSLKQKMYDRDNTQYWNDACNMNLSQLVEKYPNAVRQYMVDASPEARRLGQVALCKQSNFAPLPNKNCDGVSKQTDGTIRVNTHLVSYPYVMDRKYKIRPTGDSAVPYEVSMNMHFNVSSELYSPPPRAARQAEIDAKMTAWKEAAQGFYECQYGTRTTFEGRTCPPGGALPPGTPKMRFNFNLTSSGAAGADSTTINLHKCFNADAPANQQSSCSGVEAFSRNRLTPEKISQCSMNTIVLMWYQPDVVAIRNRLSADQRARLCAPSSNATAVLPPADIMSSDEIVKLGRLRFGGLGGAIDAENVLNAQPGDSVITESERDSRSAATRLSTSSYQIPTIGTTAARNNNYWIDNTYQMPASEQLNRGDLYARVICLPPPTGNDYRDQANTTCRQFMGRAQNASNRQNAGNYTLQQDNGTVFHEVGHIFGLDDEYLDPTYPYTPQGEHDSVMNSCDNSGRLYPRHLKQLLSPLNCPAAQ